MEWFGYYLCGVITNQITPGSGAQGNAITILFEQNAKFSSPAGWTNGAIYTATGKHDLIIDGGTNGIIECTANGDALANQLSQYGILMVEPSNVIVKNLTIQNLYVRMRGTNLVGANGIFFKWNGGGSYNGNDTVSNCVFHDMSTGWSIDYGPHCSNFSMLCCTASNVNWGGGAGDHDGTAYLNGLLVSNCYFSLFTNWDGTDTTSQATWHHNGFYAYAESGGILTNVTFIGNRVGPGYGGSSQTSGLFLSGKIWNTLVANNYFTDEDATTIADGFIFVWLHSGTNSTTATIANNTVIGGGNSVGINCFNEFGTSGGVTTTYSTSNNIINNVSTAIAVFDHTSSTLNSDDNDIYLVPDSTKCSFSSTGSSVYKTWASWQGLGYDTHSITNNPSLGSTVAPAFNFQPQVGSPVIGLGGNLSAVFGTDAKGSVRSASAAWDTGAFNSFSPALIRLH